MTYAIACFMPGVGWHVSCLALEFLFLLLARKVLCWTWRMVEFG